MKNSIKIFVSYKDKHKIVKSDVIEPIQTGRDIAKESFEGMIGDNTGENISKDNPRYNELSAQYWVWKHYEEIGNPEYIGFMHYRRHFIFDENFDTSNKKRWLPGINMFMTETLDEECTRNISTDKILNVISENCDCYAIKPYDVRLFFNNDVYMKEHYISTILGAKRYIYDTFYDVVSELYPDYKSILDEFTYGSKLNCCNMFIMKKDLFFEYSDFCFNILGEVDKRIDSSCFDSQELRFLGFLAEYCLSLFVMKLEKQNKKVKYLDSCFIVDIDKKFKSDKFFRIEKTERHKIFHVCGIKLKIRRSKGKTKLDLILRKLDEQQICINRLENKVTELQEELIVAKKH